MEIRLDEIDRQVIYSLMKDSRNTSAPDVAEMVNVSPGTIRNRIERLEKAGVITGYSARIDFERADGQLTNLYICNAPVSERESLIGQVQTIPGVINVRELMAGQRNLHVLAIGEDTADLRRIATGISKLGIDIQEEDLVESEVDHPYVPYGPEEDERRRTLSDFMSLAGGSEIVEITVQDEAPVTGSTVAEAVEDGIIDNQILLIAIEREGDILTPHGNTTIQAKDVVTLFSRGGVDEPMLTGFRGDSTPA
ncbi:winged helix-turn-helix transcriptional regulator [Halalkalicoccus tibetensis]|uniref:Winged helix-turn-helix transcriptional regulator n=1 Tax=Halalkalicoccus tibetensis TaxID=175632 RepID=A0ABD5VBJ4_9EURY